MPHWKATLEGAPFRGANTPPALFAGIPPQRRITASGYSPYRPTCHAERPPSGGLSAWRPTPRCGEVTVLTHAKRGRDRPEPL
ncbi:TPA: hypothetical protein L5651_004549 [Pseudomonas aeruginosa]|nr:hypothetical protein [Pseudomonas aeruginosa]